MKKLLTTAIILMVLLSSAWAIPDPDETRNINKFGHTGFWNTHSAQTLGDKRLSVNFYGNHSMDKKFIKNIYRWGNDGKLYYDPNIDLDDANDFLRETFNVSLSYGITRAFDMGIMLPIYVDDILGTTFGSVFHGSTEDISDFSKYSVGDIEISFKFQYPPYPHRKFFEMAYYGAITIPTGQDSRGYFPRHRFYTDKRAVNAINTSDFRNIAGVNNYYTSDKNDIDLKMIWTWDFREMSDNFPVIFHTNYGLRWTFQRSNENVFYLNAGLEVRPIEWLAILAEFSAEPRFGTLMSEKAYYITAPEQAGEVTIKTKERNWLDDPMRLSPGIAFLTPIGLTFTAGVDISVAHRYDFYYGNKPTASNDKSNYLIETGVEPKYAFVALLGWNGLTVKRQAPIVIPEPEPVVDTVHIIDTVFIDKIITDTVTIEIEKDTAPVKTFTITASVAAGQGTITPVGISVVNEGSFAQYNFSPAQGFSIEQVTVNGINQGTLAQYSFPSVKENQIITVSFKEDLKPVIVAPVAVEIPREGLVLRGVNFQSGKAVLTPNSYKVLDDVIKSLKEWPEVRLEIQGHTDNTGSKEINMKLSRERAIAVAQYFVDNGIAKNRLRPVGYGPDVPIADNSTPSGRELNRRVELKRFD